MRAYHFLPEQFASDNLTRKRIKVSTIGDLNDPFELLAARLPSRALRDAFKGFKSHMNTQMGLLCFSLAWRNPIMWTHYADKHRGVCLGFDITDAFAIPVRYISSRAACRYQDDMPSKGVDPRFAYEVMTSKFEGWAYENEVRMYISLREALQEKEFYFYSFNEHLVLKEIILGPRCGTPVSRFRELLSDNGLTPKVLKARLAFNSFTVVRNQAIA